MPTQAEEIQAKDFLKRAEIRTMKKDLLSLREGDALKERDKIAQIKTLEEQLSENNKGIPVPLRNSADKEKIERQNILQKNEGQEKIAEKDLKNYATEQERQQIFLLESQRLEFEKQSDAIDKEKDPALKLEKNKLLLKKRDLQTKLNSVLEQEKKLEDEQKFIAEKAQTTTIPSEKKGLEARRWDLDKEIQDIEKKRWEIEKQTETVDGSISQTDKSSEGLVAEKNGLKDKILGIDKSLREIYSIVMAREEEKRNGLSREQAAEKESLSKARAKENEKVQRQQWTGAANRKSIPQISIPDISIPTKKSAAKSFAAEEDQRKKFLSDVEQGAQGQPQQKSNIH